MSMIDADQAKQLAREHLWGWRMSDFDNAWKSPEERAQMTEWTLQWYEQEYPWRLAEPEEVPCGWFVCVTYVGEDSAIGGPASILINGWTGELIELYPSNMGLPNFTFTYEALIRCYIEQLPQDQRSAAMTRWDKLPFAPMRFSPPALQVSVAQWKSKMPISFTVEFDDKYFAQHNLPICELKAVQLFDDKETGDFFLEMSRTEKLYRDGKTLFDCVITVSLRMDDVPTHLKPRSNSKRIIPDLPKGVEDALPDELRQAMNLWVEIGQTPQL